MKFSIKKKKKNESCQKMRWFENWVERVKFGLKKKI